MKYLNIAAVIILAGIAFIVFRLMKASKQQSDMLFAVAMKTGAIEALAKKKAIASESSIDDDDDEFEDDGKGKSAPPPRSNLNKISRQIMDFFNDGIPKTTTQLKSLYTDKYGKVDSVKLNNTIFNLKTLKHANAEKVGKINYWGPVDWFDEDGKLYEEYTEKVSELKEITDKE